MDMTITFSDSKESIQIHIPKNEFVLYRLTQERLEKQIKKSKTFNEQLPICNELDDFVKQAPAYIQFRLRAKLN